MKRGIGFKNAFSGLWQAIRSQRNLRIHICAAFYVLAGAAILRFDWLRVCILLLCCALVISLELFNSALERFCDSETREYSRRIGQVKDMSAGAVLAAVIFAVAVGVILFFRQETVAAVSLLFEEHPYISALLVFSLIPAAIFIRGRKKNDS